MATILAKCLCHNKAAIWLFATPFDFGIPSRGQSPDNVNCVNNSPRNSKSLIENSGTYDLSRLGGGERFASRDSDNLDRGKHLARAGAPSGEAAGPRGPSERVKLSCTTHDLADFSSCNFRD